MGAKKSLNPCPSWPLDPAAAPISLAKFHRQKAKTPSPNFAKLRLWAPMGAIKIWRVATGRSGDGHTGISPAPVAVFEQQARKARQLEIAGGQLPQLEPAFLLQKETPFAQ
jgi:hypothetical protein